MSEQLGQPESQLTPEQVFQASAELLQHFGVEVNPTEQPEAFRAALSQLDPRYQGGRELVRWQLEADQTEWPETTKQIIMGAAEAMRMLVPETPLVGNYDVVIALGGARQSNLDRTRLAGQAAAEGSATFGRLVVAGSRRNLYEQEQENVSNYAPGATTEADLLVGAANTVANENSEVHPEVHVVDGEHAGTPDVIESVLQEMHDRGELPEGAKVAAITTQIYQASTELDLARVANKFGVSETFTAGNSSDPNVVAKRTPATYLSEILRTLRAAVYAAQAEVNN